MKTETTNIGDTVLCDYCNEDYTNSDAKGGIYFAGKAICPKCTPNAITNIAKYNEEKYIKAICPDDQSFADWVREVLRGGKPGEIKVTTF